jgi:hypothetical protein
MADDDNETRVKIDYIRYLNHIRHLNNHYAGISNMHGRSIIKRGMPEDKKFQGRRVGHLLESNLRPEQQIEEQKLLEQFMREHNIGTEE